MDRHATLPHRDPRATSGAVTASAYSVHELRLFEQRVLWLSTWMIHNANHLRTSRDGMKVGGHQSSCASSVTLLTALYCSAMRPQDRIANHVPRRRCMLCNTSGVASPEISLTVFACSEALRATPRARRTRLTWISPLDRSASGSQPHYLQPSLELCRPTRLDGGRRSGGRTDDCAAGRHRTRRRKRLRSPSGGLEA